MNLKQIEYLASVVKNGSFSFAAKECYVTVQAISKAMADLERELGEMHIPRLSIVFPGSVARPIAAKDMLPIPICLVSMKSGKRKAYLTLERLLKTGVKLFKARAPLRRRRHGLGLQAPGSPHAQKRLQTRQARNPKGACKPG